MKIIERNCSNAFKITWVFSLGVRRKSKRGETIREVVGRMDEPKI